MPIFLAEKKSKSFTNVKLAVDRLYINGQLFTIETLDRLPSELRPETLATRQDGEIMWFFRKDCFLSNHYPCQFTENGIQYNCVEQYFMARKAEFFNDKDAEREIMSLDDPGAQKRVRVKNFKLAEWRRQCQEHMEKGLTLKFDQNQDLKEKLLQTKSMILAEANPKDTYWGIGKGMYHPEATDITKWGQNHLGKLLVAIRQQYR